MKSVQTTLGLLLLGVVTFYFCSVPLVAAQELGIAQPVEIDAAEVADGSIVSQDGERFILSNTPFDKEMLGVVILRPPVEIVSVSQLEVEGVYPVIMEGQVQVRVSTSNGPIREGDMLTSSEIPGVAVRSDKSGFMLGIAQAGYEGEEIGLVPVLIHNKYLFAPDSPASEKMMTQFTEVLKLSGLSIIDEPQITLRYLLAAVLVIVSISITFMTVGKVAISGVQAIGRNPLASRSIIFGIMMNIVFSVAIVSAGIGSAYVVVTVGV